MTVAISGGFDPLHVGHLELIEAAAVFGDVVAIVNSDEFLKRKKGYCLLPLIERMKILEAVKGVERVVPAIDKDDTVVETLKWLRPDYFVNGGDRNTKKTIPEFDVCMELKIEPVFTGQKKIQSSSDIIKRVWPSH